MFGLANLITKEYFDSLKTQLNAAYSIASTARSKGFDPSDEVEVKIAKDVAARVEGIVGPPGVAELIRSLEKGGMSREDIAFEVARKIAGGEIMAGSKEQLIEQAVRTGLGIITEGVLVAPTEGIAKVRIMNNPDGTDYVAVYYAGPIRSAGGTAAALSLVLADIARRVCKVGDYRPTETQVMRIIEEIMTYETRCVHLQYLPSEEHQRAIIQNCPVCVHGEPTEEIEVSTCRDVPGIETNRVRSGVALVICDGLALKAAKLFKITKKLNLGWTWLEKVIKVKSKEDKIEVKPDPTYLEGLVAGRPVFSHASAIGGFRLRYGRSETNSLMSRSIHPATMVLLEGFLAFGTHMKIERPGKGCVVGAHDNLEPPIVRLRNGSVTKVRTFEEAQRIKNDVSEILFLGDILTTFGDFMKSNHPLLPSGFCSEWWALEIESKSLNVPTFKDAKSHVEFSKLHKVPLHPDYTYHYHDTSSEKLLELVKSLEKSQLKVENGEIRELSIVLDSKSKSTLEEILIEHRVVDSKVILTGDDAYAFLSSLGILAPNLTIDISPFVSNFSIEKKPLELVNQFLFVKAKAPTYIGGRMGRPEKAKERKMDGSPHVLFPTGSFKNRSVSKQYRNVKIQEGIKTLNVEIIRLKCTKCNKLGFYSKCEVCGSKAQVERICTKCGATGSMEEHCDFRTSMYDWRPIEIISLFEQVRSKLGFTPEEVKGVKGLTNVTRIPERLEKGFLRSKHDVYIFRDGTSRFDATDIPLTHFKPQEIGLSLEKAKELGYDHDYLGKPLVSDEQTVPLKHQDIVLADAGAEYFLKVGAFIDDMLLNLYNMPSYYNLKNRSDLIGHLCVGLSPHTSAGVLCRIIGFTRSTVGYGHPYFHTAKRRNCFHANTEVLIWDKSKSQYLDGTLGSITENLISSNTGLVRNLDPKTLRVDAPSNLEVLSIDPITSKIISRPIKCFIKSLDHENWVEITTTTNRKLLVTADHNVLYLNGGKLDSCTANSVKEGFELPISLKTNFNRSYKNSFNLIDLLSSLSSLDKESIVIRSSDYFKNLFYSNRELILRKVPLSDCQKRTPIRWYSSVPLTHFELLVDLGICSLDSLPQESRIAMKYDDLELPISFSLNEDLMRVLGYYISEGHSRKSASCYQVSYRVCNSQMQNYLPGAILRVFGISPNICENNSKITICSRLIYLLFTKIWKCGDCAHSKRIPKFIFSLDPIFIKAFISSFFDGDGSVVSDPPRIQFYSVSDPLLEDLSLLLSGFGIFGRFSKSKPRLPGKTLLDRYRYLGREPKHFSLSSLVLYGQDIRKFASICSPLIQKKFERINTLRKLKSDSDSRLIKFEHKFIKIPDGDYTFDKVKSVRFISNSSSAYCLDVDAPDLISKNVLLRNQIFSIRCDGDEDCVMLLMDALINFSKQYLSETRGGTMDAPLVLSTEINPKEVDDEAHEIEYVSKYPLEFYQLSEKICPPSAVKLKTVKDVLGTEAQYELPLTHPGASAHHGIIRTKYVELDSIPEKLKIQFALQERLKPVDKRDAAEKLILSHFIPDLYGNLRAYSRQTFRCVNCNNIERRPPLIGKCGKCGGNLLLTINKGGIKKYLETSAQVISRYSLPDYLRQRILLVQREIESIFEDDRIKQTDLSSFL